MKKFNPDNPFIVLKVYCPVATYEILRTKSLESSVPMSRLALIAIDNELDAPVPFNYLVVPPTNTFIPMAYAAEAQRIVKFLHSFTNGTGRDQLVLCRRDMGIPNRATFMLALRELFENGIVEEVNPPKRVKFKYPQGYKYIRLKHINRAALLNRRKRILEEQISKINTLNADERKRLAEYGIGEEDDQ